VQPLRHDPVGVRDLNHLRLVGYCAKIPLAKNVEQLVSVFDCEKELLRCPPYSGSLLEDMFAPSRDWPDEDTFLAFLHYSLSEIALKASLFYHQCCVGVQRMLALRVGCVLIGLF
jgi:hypothetical protein